MEIFLGTLIIFLLSCGALAAGQLLNRKPLSAGCRPDAAGHCKHTENCSLRCVERGQPET